MGNLKIAERFELPLDVAGEALAILAKRGAGKTNTATVLVEELVRAGVQTIVLDPVGVWWGIRSSADGKLPGLPLPILGGAHGDVTLEQTAGRLIADVAVDTGQSLLIDLSDLPTKAAMERFALDFADHLYRRKAKHSSPLHLVLEEADIFAPQSPRGGFKGDAGKLAYAIEQLVRRGRSRGIGLTMITQRSAVLNKDVLTQADVLIVMRTTGPQDINAIQDWIKSHGDERGREVLDSLPGLETGDAWIWNPEHDLLRRVHIRARQTFDSSRTPKAGDKQRVEPANSAAIDLDALGEQIKKTAEKAKADDPRELRKRIAELERQVKELPHSEVEVERVVFEQVEVQVEVPVLPEEQAKGLLDAARDLKDAASMISESADDIVREVAKVSARPRPRTEQPERRGDARAVPAPPGRSPQRAAPSTAVVDIELGKGERTVLEVLAEYPEGRTHNELAFLAGYSARASTLGVILSKLRKADLVEHGQPIRPTEEGLAAAGGVRDRPVGQALLNQWLYHPRMGEGERRVLLALVGLYPIAPSNDELCEMTGYSPLASTMGVILSKLRKLGLVAKGERRIASEFAEAING